MVAVSVDELAVLYAPCHDPVDYGHARCTTKFFLKAPHRKMVSGCPKALKQARPEQTSFLKKTVGIIRQNGHGCQFTRGTAWIEQAVPLMAL